jgi:hypothetical protein
MAEVEEQEQESFPEPMHSAPNPTGPLGPDYDRARMLSEAKERAIEQQRAKRRPRLGPQEEDEAAGSGTSNESGGAPGLSSLLQDVDTHSNYLARGQQLLKRYKRESGFRLADDDVDPCGFALWLMSLRPFLSPSSWRLYRLSGTAMIERIPHADLEKALGMLAETGRLEVEARAVYRPTLEREGGTLPMRATRMEYAHYQKIRSSLRMMSRSAAVEWLDDWLVAGISTGLLPGEWPLAHLEVRPLRTGGRKVWLHVLNAKATKGRGNGTYRTLDISDFRHETLMAVEQMVKWSERWALEGKTVKRQSDCAQLFYQICNILFPRMLVKYSLFSLRHQFISNMKSIMMPAQVAALSGHISVEAQVEHYTKRRSAWNQHHIGDVPVAIEDQVKQAQKRLTMLEEREHLRLMRKAFIEGRYIEDDANHPPDDEIEFVQ